MRPRRLDAFLGQEHLLAAGKPLRAAIEKGHLHSLVLWGSPGTGKTTLARLMAACANAQFISLPAVLAGVKDVRQAVEKARQAKREQRLRTVLFVDEVHRFNKTQQDAFLPHLEDGTLILVGATTENPSFALTNALLSRVRIYRLKPLSVVAIRAIILRALVDDEHGLGSRNLQVDEDSLALLADVADGDARRALMLLEIAADMVDACGGSMTAALAEAVNDRSRRFDKQGDIFYDQISALHKSVRGSHPDAALYWFARMIDGGCDPRYIARRVLRIASEDVGNADPRALRIVLDAWDSYERLGSPEGELAIAQALVYLACAPKSNAVYLAYQGAGRDVQAAGSLPVPPHLRNAPTQLMQEMGCGEHYRYAHDEPDAYPAGETYFPGELGERTYYCPVARGLEIKIGAKLAYLRELDRRERDSKQD